MLSPSAERGREIYVRGTSPSGDEVTALMGTSAVEVPATVLPCVNCHGEDGRGVPEGGVVPTDITWEALTKPYGTGRSGGREHPPYDEGSLALSIATGIDPGGNELHLAMPRYRLDRQDMANLIAYLKVIRTGLDPGLSPAEITIGTLLPRQGRFAGQGAAMEAALRAFFEDLNEQGGVYNRKIDLRVGGTGERPGRTAEAVRSFIDEKEPFALTGVFMEGAEKEIADLAAESEIPLVGALTLSPRQDSLVNRHVFYLDAGLEGQAQALVEFAAQEREHEDRAALAILYRQGGPLEAVIEAVESHAGDRGWTAIRKVPLTAATFDPTALAKDLMDEGTELILLLASGSPESALITEAARLGWRPQVLLPGTLASDEILGSTSAAGLRIFMAFPTLPSDRTRAGVQEYNRLAEKYKLPTEFPASQITALTSAKILVEGLKRAGGGLSRERLLAALDDLREFGTGLTPQVSYGPNRRVGIRGAHIVSLDPGTRTLVSASDWIELKWEAQP